MRLIRLLTSISVVITSLVLPRTVSVAATSSIGPVPSAPTGVSVSAKTQSSVSLSWVAAVDNGTAVSDYKIEFSDDGVNWQTFSDGVSANTSVTVTGLARSVGYVFRVSAVNANGTGLPGLALGAKMLSSGSGNHFCILKSDQSVWCWGRNDYGQLGFGPSPSFTYAFGGAGSANGSGTTVQAWPAGSAVSVTTGQDFTCIATVDGLVQCVGRGDSGQLGNSASSNSAVAVQVTNVSTATNVAAGANFACALLVDTSVQCWGDNTYGQLGNGTNTSSNSPVIVKGLRGVTAVATGDTFACALLASRAVKCWGRGLEGQIGNGGNLNTNVPLSVSGMASAQNIVLGSNYACALMPDNTIQCWGENTSGQLGDGTTTSRNTPVQVLGVGNAAEISAGGSTTCSALVTGQVMCWGLNNYGQVGNGNKTDVAVAVTVGGVGNVSTVSVAGQTSCALLADNELRCWGQSTFGQLDDGTVTPSINGWFCFNWGCTGSWKREHSSSTTPVIGINFATLDQIFVSRTRPNAPTSVRYQNRTSSGITLIWSAPDQDGASSITAYLLQSSADGGRTWVPLGDDQVSRLSSTTTTSQVTGLTAGVTYAFRVAAVNALGTSDWSTNSVQALAVSNPSGGTSVFVTGKTATTVSLAWAAPGSKDYPVQSYVVKLSTDNGFTWAPIAPQNIQFGNDVPTTATIGGLTRGTSYLFSVAPLTNQGVGSAVTIGEAVIPAVAPSQPGIAAMTGRTVNSISLNWAASPDNGGRPLIGYDIRISSDGGTNWSTEDTGWIVRTSPTDTSATITNLVMGTTYLFQIAAVSPEGPSAWSRVSGPMLAAEVPGQVSGVKLAPNSLHDPITLTWTSPSPMGSAITGYSIESSIDEGNTWRPVDSAAISRSSDVATTATVRGLVHGTNYWFRVAAINALGMGSAGVIDQPIICAVPASAPQNIVSTSRKVWGVGLSWRAPADDGGRPVTGYVVRTSMNSGQTWQAGSISDVVMTDQGASAMVFNLSMGVNYIFQTAALTAEGAGAWSTSSEPVLTAEVPGAVSGLKILSSAVHDPISLTWQPAAPNGAAVTRYIIEATGNGGATWSRLDDSSLTRAALNSTAATITGLIHGTNYSFRVSAENSVGVGGYLQTDSSVTSAVPPAAPRTIRVLSRAISNVNLSWLAPLDTGGQPVRSYDVRVSSDGGQTWQQSALTNAGVTPDGGTGTASGLVTGKQYIFSVRAVNVEGPGPWSGSSEAAQTSTAPDAVTTLAIPTDAFGDPDLADDHITFNWTPPLANGSPITKYTMQISDDGTSWSAPLVLPPSTTTYTISNLQQSQARLVRIFASNAEGDGPMSEDFVVTTGGLPQMTVAVVDSKGLPVTGGAITWAMDDGSARSVVTYGLTADGIIQFPGAPAGRVTVTLSHAQMQDGSTVSGQWHAVLGLKSNILVVPAAPAVAVHTAHVILSSGQPISNVQVDMSGMDDLATTVSSSGFTFTLPKVTALSGLTDVNGNFSVVGFSNKNPYVQVKYDDGVISQTKAGQTTSPVETIKLRSLPFATFDSGSVQGSLGVPIPVVVSAGFGSGSSLRGLRAVGSGRRGVTVSSGVQVTLVGPAGAKLTSCSSSKVKPILSAKTDASGKAKLLVCPTRSGVYTLRTKGALSVGSVNVLVKGAAPFAVNSVTVRCPVPGVVHASWNKPIFDGGMPVTKYVVTLSAPGQKTVTKTLLAKLDVKGKVLKAPPTVLDVSGLANATTYKAQITAVTVNGMSDAYTTTIPVA